MKDDVNGCSICPAGEENYESFDFRGKELIQYDYRTKTGELFSCVAPTLEQCRAKRDQWVRNN